jgi:hypothetical protein
VHEDFNFEREQGEREEAEAAAGDAGVRDDATSGAVVAHAILYESFAVPPAASLAWPAGLRGVDSHLAAADYAARYGAPPVEECVLGVPLRRLLRSFAYASRSGEGGSRLILRDTGTGGDRKPGDSRFTVELAAAKTVGLHHLVVELIDPESFKDGGRLRAFSVAIAYRVK